MDLKDLDKWYPPCGPCAFCGFHDKRHRLWDMWCGMNKAGDTVESIAKNYEQPVEYVQAVIDIQPYQGGSEEE